VVELTYHDADARQVALYDFVSNARSAGGSVTLRGRAGRADHTPEENLMDQGADRGMGGTARFFGQIDTDGDSLETQPVEYEDAFGVSKDLIVGSPGSDSLDGGRSDGDDFGGFHFFWDFIDVGHGGVGENDSKGKSRNRYAQQGRVSQHFRGHEADNASQLTATPEQYTTPSSDFANVDDETKRSLYGRTPSQATTLSMNAQLPADPTQVADAFSQLNDSAVSWEVVIDQNGLFANDTGQWGRRVKRESGPDKSDSPIVSHRGLSIQEDSEIEDGQQLANAPTSVAEDIDGKYDIAFQTEASLQGANAPAAVNSKDRSSATRPADYSGHAGQLPLTTSKPAAATPMTPMTPATQPTSRAGYRLRLYFIGQPPQGEVPMAKPPASQPAITYPVQSGQEASQKPSK